MIDGLQPHMFMNIRILLVFFLLFLLKFDILDSTHQTKKGNKFWEPCFEEEENFAHSSSIVANLNQGLQKCSSSPLIVSPL